jgi:hypothetical protein
VLRHMDWLDQIDDICVVVFNAPAGCLITHLKVMASRRSTA